MKPSGCTGRKGCSGHRMKLGALLLIESPRCVRSAHPEAAHVVLLENHRVPNVYSSARAPSACLKVVALPLSRS